MVTGVIASLALASELLEAPNDSVELIVFGTWDGRQTIHAMLAISLVLCAALIVGGRRVSVAMHVAVVWVGLLVAAATATVALWIVVRQLDGEVGIALATASWLFALAAAVVLLAIAARTTLAQRSGEGSARGIDPVRFMEWAAVMVGGSLVAGALAVWFAIRSRTEAFCGEDPLGPAVLDEGCVTGWWSQLVDALGQDRLGLVLVAAILGALAAARPGRHHLASLRGLATAVTIVFGGFAAWQLIEPLFDDVSWRTTAYAFAGACLAAAILLACLPVLAHVDNSTHAALTALAAFGFVAASAASMLVILFEDTFPSRFAAPSAFDREDVVQLLAAALLVVLVTVLGTPADRRHWRLLTVAGVGALFAAIWAVNAVWSMFASDSPGFDGITGWLTWAPLSGLMQAVAGFAIFAGAITYALRPDRFERASGEHGGGELGVEVAT